MYKAVPNKEDHNDSICNIYFIRRKNWYNLVEKMKEHENTAFIIPEFKKSLANTYLKKILEPI